MSVKRLEKSAGADQVVCRWWGGLGNRPASPPSRCFGCWRSLRSCGRRRPVYPQGKVREIPGGNQRRRSAAGTFTEPQAPTKEGLDGPERTRTIRQDSSQNVVDKTGPGAAEPCGAGTGPTAGRASGRPFLVSPANPPSAPRVSMPATLTSAAAQPRAPALNVRMAVNAPATGRPPEGIGLRRVQPVRPHRTRAKNRKRFYSPSEARCPVGEAASLVTS